MGRLKRHELGAVSKVFWEGEGKGGGSGLDKKTRARCCQQGFLSSGAGHRG